MQNESLHFVYAWDTIWSDCKVLKILSVCGWESTKFHLLTVAICAAAAMNKMNRKQKGKFHSIALLLLLMTANDAASQLISTSVHHKNNDSSLEDREIQPTHNFFPGGSLMNNVTNIEQHFRNMNFIWQHFISKFAWKVKNTLKALRFLYQDFESEFDIAMCYIKYFQVIPGLRSGRNNNANKRQLSELFSDLSYPNSDRHQLLKNNIRSMNDKKKFNVGSEIIKLVMLMLTHLKMITKEILQTNGKRNLHQESEYKIGSTDIGTNISLPRLNSSQRYWYGENIGISDIITNVYTALYLSFYGEMPAEYLNQQGDLKFGSLVMNWTKKCMEIFNTHTLVKCTRKYLMKKIWSWVDAEERPVT
ncbi:uncharacterized protein LOC126272612 isoform X1 [Schistocerca gregaria]|uniref:uncharacterized protein LOC126272612 isoform X1 n=1 Tax=Schistocerca gregaria TaxID=7010 RepID=UPI00211DBC1E|nr:uncharacterized protein LOC126272612 isoform X1 [Schistocerca gregaria]